MFAFLDDVKKLSGRPDKGIAVLVSSEALDDASEIITTREEMDAHILAHPDDGDFEDDDDDEDYGDPDLGEDIDDEDMLFHKDLFDDEDEPDF